MAIQRWLATCCAFALCALAIPSTASASDDILNAREINITGKYFLFPVSNKDAIDWFFASALTLVFPKMAEVFAPAVIFGFFCFMMVLQLVWVKAMVPETKGVPLEEMQKKLAG